MKKYASYDFMTSTLVIQYDTEDQCITKISLTEFQYKTNVRTELTNKVYTQILEYMDGKRATFDIPYRLEGTDFQKKVWQSLCDIPYGETRSYKQIAELLGTPNGSRAIGNANNHNPLLIVVPCHRVISSKGVLRGYAGGIAMQQQLLDIEKKNKDKFQI